MDLFYYRNWTLLVCCVLFFGCGGLQPNTVSGSSAAEGAVEAGTKPSRESILALMEASGASETMRAAFDQMALMMKSEFQKRFKSEKQREMFESYWRTFESKYDAASLIDEIVPIYQKHLDQRTVNELIVFYQSPTGKKLVASTPTITKESMKTGQSWGQKMAKAAIAELKAKAASSKAKMDANADQKSKTGTTSDGDKLPEDKN